MPIRSIISTSYEAGGLYPTFLGYFVGALIAIFISISDRWFVRYTVPFVGAVFLAQCFQDFERTFAILMTMGAVTGACCTYVQLWSWKLAFAHLETKRKLGTKIKKNA